MLALAVLGPLLQPGYIFALDMVFVPNPDFTPAFYGISENLISAAATPFNLTLQLLSHIIPISLLEKVIFFSILFLAALGNA